MSQISITASETALWHALIGRAEFHAQQLLPQAVENYLVTLFIRFDQEESLYFQLKKNQHSNSDAEYKLQRLGDQCLLLCGFYPEASDEYGVSLDEFMSMGSEAYESLSKASSLNAIIFEYLANNFEQMTSMLRCISNVTDMSLDKQKTGRVV